VGECILARVEPARSHKTTIALALAVIGALIAGYSARDRHEPVTQTRAAEKTVASAPFDFYLLTMSLHAAFCADGHARLTECAGPASRPLVIHGLWPEAETPGAYPHDCPAPPLHLQAALSFELEDYMPGMRAGLHVHEWRTHGACAGLDAERYFRATLDLARALDAALSPRLTTLAGRETSAGELRAAADAYRAGLGATLVFQCRTVHAAPAAQRERPFLIEVRQCIGRDGSEGAPGAPLDCSMFNRRDQGCGQHFFIAGPRA
jgi:ribonuclease T2